MKLEYKPIGVVHSPFKGRKDIQPKKYANARGFDHIQGELEIYEEYKDGLKDTEGFSHLMVLFAFHLSEGFNLHLFPLLEDKLRGVFSTRSSHRPNPIGLTIVKVLERRGNILKVSGVDMIEGTPILDIKPYTLRDQKSPLRLGWLEGKIKSNK